MGTRTGTAGVVGFARQSSKDATAGTPYNSETFAAGANEVQTITITGVPTGGGFTAEGFDSDVSGEIAFDATGAEMQFELEQLDSIGVGNVSVSGAAGGPFVVTFINELQRQNLALLIIDDAGLTGGTTPAATNVQTTPGAADTPAWFYIPCQNASMQSNQIVSAIPPEVGGDDWSRGSYKGGVSGQGQISFIPRGGLGLAELLYGFSGSATKLAGDGTNGAAVGNFIYTLTPAFAGVELPWYTVVRNTANAYAEEFADARIGSFAFDLSATGLLMIDSSFISRKCDEIPLGSGAAAVGTQRAGNGISFQAVDALVKLETNQAGVPGPVAKSQYKPTRLNIGFANQLTGDEFVIGSHFLEDVTKIARSAMVSYGFRLKDAELYRRVYSAGVEGSWSPEIWKGALHLELRAGIIGSTADRYKLTVSLPEMDYQAAPVSLSGNSIVEFQLTANVVLSQDPNVRPYTITYVTDEDITVS